MAAGYRDGAEAGRPDDAVLVRVTVGQVPRDTCGEDGQVVKVDAETGRRLLESGQAEPVRADQRGRR